MRHTIPRTLAVLAAVLLAATACGRFDSGSGSTGDSDSLPQAAEAVSGKQVPARPRSVPADPASVGADETAAVPVLMYHQIIASPAGVYDRTPQDFRAELERLAGEGYVPITAAEYATGIIDIPAGAHPVVLTFDDSTKSQFGLGLDGEPIPDTAIGILLDVARSHPHFRPVATMFVNSDPFGDPGGRSTLPWLRDHGFEIGNHTHDHTNLRTASSDTAIRQIIDAQVLIQAAVPGTTVETLALPFGAEPRPATLAVKGSSGGIDYDHRGVFLVGSNPAPSPFTSTFDPGAIPRIRSQGASGHESEFGSAVWLDKLANGEVRRYTSDGNPSTVAYPRTGTPPAPAYAARALTY